MEEVFLDLELRLESGTPGIGVNQGMSCTLRSEKQGYYIHRQFHKT